MPSVNYIKQENNPFPPSKIHSLILSHTSFKPVCKNKLNETSQLNLNKFFLNLEDKTTLYNTLLWKDLGTDECDFSFLFDNQNFIKNEVNNF